MADEPMPTMKDLMALVGTFLVRWGWLERSLAGQPFPVEVDGVRAMRNAICHGIISAHADPASIDQPHIRCSTRQGSIVTFTAGDIDEAIRTMERVGGRNAPVNRRG